MFGEPKKIKNYENRFGIVAVRKGYITLGQLIKARRIQSREDLNGEEHRLIGEILFHQGHMTPAEIEDVLKTMFKARESI
jgi:hypothetical protein